MVVAVSPKKKYYSFMIDPDMAVALKRIKERDGIAESEQIRRGIELWLKTNDGGTKAQGRRAVTRKPR